MSCHLPPKPRLSRRGIGKRKTVHSGHWIPKHGGGSIPRGRKTSLTIRLTADERQTLLAWQRSTTIPAGSVRRGQIMLLLGDGMPVVQIADTVGVTHRVVYKWARRFLQDGIAGLADKPGRGRRPVLTTPVKGAQDSQRKRARIRSRRYSNHRASRVAMPRGRTNARRSPGGSVLQPSARGMRNVAG